MAGLNIPLNVGASAAGGAGLLGTLAGWAHPLGWLLSLGSLFGGLFGGGAPKEPPPPTWREQMQMNRRVPPPQRRLEQAPRRQYYHPRSDFMQYLQKFL